MLRPPVARMLVFIALGVAFFAAAAAVSYPFNARATFEFGTDPPRMFASGFYPAERLILAPLAFVPLRTPAMFLAVPPLIEVLGSRMSTTYTLGTHYAGAWLGYVLAAFAAGIVALAPRGRARTPLCWAVALCAIELLVANPLHPGSNLRPIQPRDVQLDSALQVLPRDAGVATQEEAYTHLALDDPFARLLPEDPHVVTNACFVLVDRAYPDSPRLQEYGGAFRELVRTGRYALADRAGEIELYRRLTPCR